MWNTPESAIEQELSRGERLVWSGQPRRGIRLRAADLFIIPFSILWCGFFIFWEAEVLTMSKFKAAGPIGIVFALFGLPFVVIGLHLVFGRFLADAAARKRTFYGLTSDRILIVSGWLSRRTKSLNLRTLSDISLIERRDGSGTITFGPSSPFGQWFPMGSWPGAGQLAPPAFDMIDDAKTVYDLIRETQKTAT